MMSSHRQNHPRNNNPRKLTRLPIPHSMKIVILYRRPTLILNSGQPKQIIATYMKTTQVMVLVKNPTTVPKAFLQQLMALTIQIYPQPQPSKTKAVRTPPCKSLSSPNNNSLTPSPNPLINNLFNNHQPFYPTLKSNNSNSRCSHPLKPSKLRRHRSGTTWRLEPRLRMSWSRPSLCRLAARRRRSRSSRRRRRESMLTTGMGNTQGRVDKSWTHSRI